ncbi:hypothetical protein P43SY_003720 [Pythium insidiosum]|uniref:Myotubularin-like protein n=1 Tax=Pythium insidiosum TaxID=114742 RepID=A0AAD5LG12_PYTIN|nr:hypothetical protein P43SY_003720 [Pythium insidiosum]
MDAADGGAVDGGGGVAGLLRRKSSSLKKRLVEEDSWTSVERQELDHATSYVSDSMYLVMATPASTLVVGETVLFKAHALCDRSTMGLAGVARVRSEPRATPSNGSGTLFLTNYRLLFLSFHGHSNSLGKNDQAAVQEIVEVVLNNVAELYECRVTAKNGVVMNQLEISCKNLEIVRFNFPEFFVRINKALAANQPQFAYACADISTLPDTSGWGVYDPHAEFVRLNFKTLPSGPIRELRTAPSAGSSHQIESGTREEANLKMNVWNRNEDLALEECKLLSGGFATFLQVLLGIIALSVLVVKRYHEVPRRPVTVWAFDASKQMIGAGFAHVANLLIAIMLYQYEHGHGSASSGVDQCAFYFVNFTMDTTVGSSSSDS